MVFKSIQILSRNEHFWENQQCFQSRLQVEFVCVQLFNFKSNTAFQTELSVFINWSLRYILDKNRIEHGAGLSEGLIHKILSAS
jgi:hypothetical protein